MGLTRSLSTGASSLRAHQQKFDVISNNLANANTVGYKSNRAVFQEQFNQIMNYGKSPDIGGSSSSAMNPLQFGLGVKLGSIQQNMNQGAIETTDRALDLALQGDGFFVFNDFGNEKYSRAGNITMDRDGNLVDSATGASLQGYNVETDADGRITRDTLGINSLSGLKENLKIEPNVLSSPKQTEFVAVTGNLRSSNEEGYEKKTSITVFDNIGGAHDLKLTFTKTANANEYSLTGDLNGELVNLSDSLVAFNNDGTLNTPLEVSVSAADLNAAIGNQIFDETTPKDITIQLADPDSIVSGLTQYAMTNTASISAQDGYQSGSLLDLSVDDNGKVYGAFTNGQTELLGQVLIAKFTNDEGLVRNGDNFYTVSPNSGMPNIGTAGEIFPSTKIASNALEQSNVDMTIEFTEMISTQRAFEAAARTITVTDQMLQETTILKR